MPPAIQGTSSSTIAHASDQYPPSTYKLDAKKLLWYLKTQKDVIPIEGTSDQKAFFSELQQPKQVSPYKPCPKSKKKQLPQPDKDQTPTESYSDSDSDIECQIEKIEYDAQRLPQRAPRSSAPHKPTNQSDLTPGGKPAVVVQKLPIKVGDIEYDIRVTQVVDRKRHITHQSSDHSSTKDKKKKHKHSKRDKDRDAN